MTTPAPILSIVVASSNQLNSLKFTLLTLRDQPPQVPYEIIVVDCDSQDDSAQFLANQAENNHLRVIFEPGHGGRTAARNRGAREATGKYLMFLDPGVVMGPHWSVALLETLDRDPMVGAVAGKVILPDGLIDHAGLAVLEMPSETGKRLIGRSVHAGQCGDIEGSLRPLVVQGLAGEAMMVRATAFFGVDGFDEGLGRQFGRPKDMAEAEPAGLDLSLRLGSRDWQCIYRHESIMTRLRVSEAVVSGNEVSVSRMAADDFALVSANWLGKVRPDFHISADGRVSPSTTGYIRPYIIPGIAFSSQNYGGMIHPDRSAATATDVSSVVASIIVVTHNSLAEVRQCAASLLAHTDRRHELLLVNNGSSDGTAAYLSELAAAHPEIRVVELAENQGYAAGVNVGMAVAIGRHLILLAESCVVTDGWVERLIRTAEAHPRAGLIGAVSNNVVGLQRLSNVPYEVQDLDGLADFAAQLAAEHQGRADHIARLNDFCLLIKRELVARVGGLDPIFSGHCYEDQDYCLRAQLAGYECLIARDCFVHRSGPVATGAGTADVIRQWDIFKAKWHIPASTSFIGHVDISTLVKGGFKAEEHFCPLPVVTETVREALTSEV